MNEYQSAKQIVSHVYAMARILQVYDHRNEVVIKTGQKLLNYVTEGPAEIFRYREYLFLNKERLRYEIDGYESLHFIHNRLKELGVKALTFLPGLTQAELINFMTLFSETKDAFDREFDLDRFPHLSLEFGEAEEASPELEMRTQQAKWRYFKALKVTKNLMSKIAVKQPVDSRTFRRAMFGLIDSLVEDESGMLALTAIKNFDEYTYNHSLNVGVLSMALGQRVGLNKAKLARLGTAGILHDMGKLVIPKEVLYKEGPLTDEEWETMRRHADQGVEQILKTRGVDEIGLISILVSFQHHWNLDGSGYPDRGKDQQPALFSRIVRVCDTYDAMTTSRPYQKTPILPHYALQVLWSHRDSWFDRLLVKVFTQMLGVYPVTTCLELSSGEIAVVVRQNPGFVDRPVVKILRNSEKKEVEGVVIDLSVDSSLAITKVVYPQQYGIDTASHII